MRRYEIKNPITYINKLIESRKTSARQYWDCSLSAHLVDGPMYFDAYWLSAKFCDSIPSPEALYDDEECGTFPQQDEEHGDELIMPKERFPFIHFAISLSGTDQIEISGTMNIVTTEITSADVYTNEVGLSDNQLTELSGNQLTELSCEQVVDTIDKWILDAKNWEDLVKQIQDGPRSQQKRLAFIAN